MLVTGNEETANPEEDTNNKPRLSTQGPVKAFIENRSTRLRCTAQQGLRPAVEVFTWSAYPAHKAHTVRLRDVSSELDT